MRPDPGRIERNIEELGRIGKVGETGVSRLTFTKDDLAGREYMMEEMRRAGLEVTVDPVGNIFGKRVQLTEDPSLPSVMVGSHIDTPLVGGKYDGVVGVIGGLEVVRMLNDERMKTRHPIEVVIFAGEELTRFGSSFKGSLPVVGSCTEKLLKEVWVDKQGVSYWDTLASVGLKPEDFEKAKRSPESIKCYFEMHIEQGPVLEDIGKSVGLVSAIAGATRGWATIKGLPNHSGAFPMRLRKDALAAASEIVLEMEAAARREAHLGTVGTIGDLVVKPGVMNIIPGEVTMSLEVRGVDIGSKNRVLEDLRRKFSEVAASRNMEIQYHYNNLGDDDPFVLDGELRELLEESAKQEGIDYIVMPSGAGHDAMFMTRITRVGMLFVPSVAGKSHVPEEFTETKDLVLGTSVLAGAVLKMACSR